MGIQKLLYSFSFAIAGVRHALKYNQNLQIHFAVAFIVLLLSLYFRISRFEFGMVGVMIVITIASEMINTAIEQMVDLITLEHRQQAKVAKDVAAGMVLVTATGAFIVGVAIFLPYIIKTINLML